MSASYEGSFGVIPGANNVELANHGRTDARDDRDVPGIEQCDETLEKLAVLASSGVLVAGDDVLARLLKLWPMLSDEARQAVLAHAQQLALSPVTLQKVPSAGHSDTIMEQYQEAVAVFLTGRKP